ncbi:MAG: hypothetical protein R2698_11750 [Microthrixaceae bacterium]
MAGTADQHVVATQSELAALVRTLLDAERYAIDTEFHRERTYFPNSHSSRSRWGATRCSSTRWRST